MSPQKDGELPHSLRLLLHRPPPDRSVDLAPGDRGHSLGDVGPPTSFTTVTRSTLRTSPTASPGSASAQFGLRLDHPSRTPWPRGSSGLCARELLDHVIILNERHLSAVLGEFAGYHNRDRPHRSLALQPPLPRPGPPVGSVVARPMLGGLHHAYSRAA